MKLSIQIEMVKHATFLNGFLALLSRDPFEMQRVSGLGFWVSGFRVSCFGFRVSGSRPVQHKVDSLVCLEQRVARAVIGDEPRDRIRGCDVPGSPERVDPLVLGPPVRLENGLYRFQELVQVLLFRGSDYAFCVPGSAFGVTGTKRESFMV